MVSNRDAPELSFMFSPPPLLPIFLTLGAPSCQRPSEHLSSSRFLQLYHCDLWPVPQIHSEVILAIIVPVQLAELAACVSYYTSGKVFLSACCRLR